MIKRDMDKYAREQALGKHLADFTRWVNYAQKNNIRGIAKKMNEEVAAQKKAEILSARGAEINGKGVLSAVNEDAISFTENKTICNGDIKEAK